ncbi:hypothetical protein KAR91_67275 [Candidatus Pacearchaeota archaeon]|nr:hypothetical protein [Candidatus Pacearchaeota archaeon]
MAIDTAEKRRSVSGVHWAVAPGVTPESAKDAEWRSEAAYSYSGISYLTVLGDVETFEYNGRDFKFRYGEDRDFVFSYDNRDFTFRPMKRGS